METLEFLGAACSKNTQNDFATTRTSLEIILKLSSKSKLKAQLSTNLAKLANFFIKLVELLESFTKNKDKANFPVYDCGLILDTISLMLEGSM